MKKNKKIKVKRHRAKVLFDNNLPFRHKVEADKTKYNRKQKHKTSEE